MSAPARRPSWRAKTGVARACIHSLRRDGSTRHPHGTYNRWLLDRCRCGACTVAGVRRQKIYRVGARPKLAPMVPALRVAEHIEALHQSGLSRADLARRLGVSKAAVRRYTYRRTGMCRWETAAPILAIPVSPTPYAGAAGYVDATGSRRRLQALAVLGWPLGAAADRVGVKRETLTAIRMGHVDVVRSRTAAQVAAAYRVMVLTPPTASQRSLVSQSRTKAKQRGWVGPMAWDSVTIEDPAAAPFDGLDEEVAA